MAAAFKLPRIFYEDWKTEHHREPLSMARLWLVAAQERQGAKGDIKPKRRPLWRGLELEAWHIYWWAIGSH
jgi:hypothetical protein